MLALNNASCIAHTELTLRSNTGINAARSQNVHKAEAVFSADPLHPCIRKHDHARSEAIPDLHVKLGLPSHAQT